MRNKLVLIGLTCALISCQNPDKEEVESLKKKAIEVHDAVMPRMGEIAEISSSLKSLRNKEREDTTMTSDSLISVLNGQIFDLDQAYEAMMDWMAQYDPTFNENNPIDSAKAYYAQQVEEIEQIKKAMEASIQNGNNLLENVKK